ncbi:hypothetical protein [Streptomyces collinus]|uniref:hypothetical protein n=1 Tax=Streptomyces collinus TaxID=42684 RepID=UPI0033F4BF4A
MRRLAALLLALAAVLGIGMTAPQTAAADHGPVGAGVEMACKYGPNQVLGTILDKTGLCDKIGGAVDKVLKKAWDDVWHSTIGDVITTCADVAKWVIRKTLTVALSGPSMDLKGTGLWTGQATLAGMLTWLGLVIAALGMMWQLGKMAVTGQMKYAGQAMAGWVQSTIISAVGVGLIALMLTAGDAMTSGLVKASFGSTTGAYERIIAVMVPQGVSNPVMMGGIVGVVVLVGFIQMVMIFLRQSAIPIQCLLLPIAGAGRVGGETTRKWAPRLITSICVAGVYKPMVAVIICTGFSEFGESQTLAEWFRGLATLTLGVLAPAPMIKVFAPFGEEVGAALSSGGSAAAMASVPGYFAGRQGKGGNGGSAGVQPATPVAHAQLVQASMGPQGGGNGGNGGGSAAQAQAARTGATVPAQGGPSSGSGGPGSGSGGPGGGGGQSGASGAAAGAPGPQGPPGSGGSGGGGAAGGGAGIAIQVLDGVNNGIQGASGTIGDGGNQR